MIRAIVFNGEVVRYVDDNPSPGDLTKPHPSKPHVLPVERDQPAFDPVSQVLEPRVVTVHKDRVVWLDPVRDKTPEEVAKMVAGKVLDIKAEAQRRILAIMPAYRQTNWLALKAEMDLRYGAPANWPAEVQQGIAALKEAVNGPQEFGSPVTTEVSPNGKVEVVSVPLAGSICTRTTSGCANSRSTIKRKALRPMPLSRAAATPIARSSPNVSAGTPNVTQNGSLFA